MYAFRSFCETLLRTQRANENGASEVDRIDSVGAFDLALKLPSRPRLVWAPLVTVHVTAVTGGFGTSARQRTAAVAHGGPGDTPAENALLKRYYGTAYHRIGSRMRGGSAIRNHPPELRTSHGNGGNRGLGWALDCGASEPLSAGLRNAGLVSLADTIRDAYGDGQDGPVSVVPHRVFSAARRGDTAAIVWAEVVLPVVASMSEICKVDYELAEGGGRPVPRSWDPAALFDDRGRPVRDVL